MIWTQNLRNGECQTLRHSLHGTDHTVKAVSATCWGHQGTAVTKANTRDNSQQSLGLPWCLEAGEEDTSASPLSVRGHAIHGETATASGPPARWHL